MKKFNVLVVLLPVLVSMSTTFGQDNKLLKVLELVEEKQRTRLAERLKLFIEYHWTQQWAKLYKLIDKANAGNKNATEFAREMSKMNQFAFVPERAEAEDSYYSQY